MYGNGHWAGPKCTSDVNACAFHAYFRYNEKDYWMSMWCNNFTLYIGDILAVSSKYVSLLLGDFGD